MSGQRVHGTAVATPAGGLLLMGPPGAGKSDLALRLVEAGAVLVADDQVLLAAGPAGILASAPPSLAGLIEVRGVGILRLPYRRRAAIRLVLDLATPPPRLPPPPDAWPMRIFDGIALPVLALAPFEVSAPAKALAGLALLGDGGRDGPAPGHG